ncbi:hypothetical protein GGR35_000707 [Mucilaginibacter phyllosphaerae]|uniref:Uncharacterized protein n=1 Tax=Mucilaginibacter phyllosphaerae TaxID=1812349 RepID=A0ABR6I5L6_9SPHI|nr:hypothetical protein [Mucilaginibacter phyllosphaerae]
MANKLFLPFINALIALKQLYKYYWQMAAIKPYNTKIQLGENDTQ